MKALPLIGASALAILFSNSLAQAQATTGPGALDGQGPEIADPVMTIDDMRFQTWEAYTGSEVFRDRGLRCGRRRPESTTLPWSVPQGLSMVAADCAYSSTNPTSAYAPTTLLNIPVVFHIIQRTNGTGAVSPTRVQQQIDILNEDFRALAGTPGSPGVDTMIQFHLATVDPNGNPTNGITNSVNNTWFNDGGNYWNSLAWDTDEYLNIYSNSAGGFLGYVPDIPQGGLVGNNNDRVVVLWSTIGRNGPIGPPYNQGRTVTHEIGHYLGLEHTFSGGCHSGNCYTRGDLICDTNRQQSDTFGCPSNPTSCGTTDPFHNYMDYTNDVCMWEFTEEQARRMRCTLQFWRPDLADGGGTTCLPATAASRTAGTNPNSLFVTLPVLGTTMTAQVNLITTGHSLAVLFGAVNQTNVPLPSGSVLLANILAPFGDVLGLAPQGGVIPLFSIAIPNDSNLCGLDLTLQAAHVGGVTPFALSNAQDITLGT